MSYRRRHCLHHPPRHHRPHYPNPTSCQCDSHPPCECPALVGWLLVCWFVGLLVVGCWLVGCKGGFSL